MRGAVACSLVVLAVVGEPPRAQTPSQTFRTGVDLVQVDVTVLDRDRRPIRDLTQADFTVLEDGKPRTIAAFTPVDLPPPEPEPLAKWMLNVRSDVVSNDVSREGRLVVILMDRSIRTADSVWAKRIATAAVDRLGPDDLGAVTYSLWGTPQNFTADRRRLREAIAQPFMGSSPTIAGNPAECRCGLCTLETMTRVADSLRDVPQRRKMLIFIGRTMPIQSSGDCGGLQREARQDFQRAAQVANLTVHVFDPSGLEGYALGASARGPAPAGMPLARSNLLRQGNLSYFPDLTGGVTVLNSNAPEDRMLGVFRESSTYYVLGFEPADRRQDGRHHDIRIKVRRPDTTVQARRGYYAPGGKVKPPPPGAAGAAPSLVDALASFWPRTAVPMSLTVAPFATNDANGAATAIVLHVRQDEMGVIGNIDVLTGAFDPFGRSTNFQRQTVSVSPRITAEGEFEYEVLSRLSLKPGRYEIRAALEDASRLRTGSVYTYVDVPDFARDPLSLSGVVVDAAPSAPSAPAVAFRDLLPVTPRARRTFARSDQATAFVRAYQGRSRGLSSVTITARILDDSDTPVYQQTTSIRGAEFAGDRSADYGFDLPLRQLKPGEHLLRIEAMSGAAQVRRELRFAVQ